MPLNETKWFVKSKDPFTVSGAVLVGGRAGGGGGVEGRGKGGSCHQNHSTCIRVVQTSAIMNIVFAKNLHFKSIDKGTLCSFQPEV